MSIEQDIAWEALGDHLIHGARRVWSAMMASLEADEQERADFWAQMDAGQLIVGNEVLGDEEDEDVLPFYAFGREPEGDIAVFLVLRAIDETDGPLAYIGIGWVDADAPPAHKPPRLRILPGGIN